MSHPRLCPSPPAVKSDQESIGVQGNQLWISSLLQLSIGFYVCLIRRDLDLGRKFDQILARHNSTERLATWGTPGCDTAPNGKSSPSRCDGYLNHEVYLVGGTYPSEKYYVNCNDYSKYMETQWKTCSKPPNKLGLWVALGQKLQETWGMFPCTLERSIGSWGKVFTVRAICCLSLIKPQLIILMIHIRHDHCLMLHSVQWYTPVASSRKTVFFCGQCCKYKFDVWLASPYYPHSMYRRYAVLSTSNLKISQKKTPFQWSHTRPCCHLPAMHPATSRR